MEDKASLINRGRPAFTHSETNAIFSTTPIKMNQFFLLHTNPIALAQTLKHYRTESE